jgi:hypothetical protein
MRQAYDDQVYRSTGVRASMKVLADGWFKAFKKAAETLE